MKLFARLNNLISAHVFLEHFRDEDEVTPEMVTHILIEQAETRRTARLARAEMGQILIDRGVTASLDATDTVTLVFYKNFDVDDPNADFANDNP